jgi:hypothetical protein
LARLIDDSLLDIRSGDQHTIVLNAFSLSLFVAELAAAAQWRRRPKAARWRWRRLIPRWPER